METDNTKKEESELNVKEEKKEQKTLPSLISLPSLPSFTYNKEEDAKNVEGVEKVEKAEKRKRTNEEREEKKKKKTTKQTKKKTTKRKKKEEEVKEEVKEEELESESESEEEKVEEPTRPRKKVICNIDEMREKEKYRKIIENVVPLHLTIVEEDNVYIPLSRSVKEIVYMGTKQESTEENYFQRISSIKKEMKAEIEYKKPTRFMRNVFPVKTISRYSDKKAEYESYIKKANEDNSIQFDNTITFVKPKNYELSNVIFLKRDKVEEIITLINIQPVDDFDPQKINTYRSSAQQTIFSAYKATYNKPYTYHNEPYYIKNAYTMI